MIRNDFVSNSSSSSFILISDDGKDLTEDISKKYLEKRTYPDTEANIEFPVDYAKHEFGWEFEDTSSFEGKLNFIALQLLHLLCLELTHINKKRQVSKDFSYYYNLVRKVCLEKFGFVFKIRTKLIEPRIYPDKDIWTVYYSLDFNYYIDHQSCITEGSCDEMFKSEETMYNFLRFEESMIEGGNDNTPY